MHDDRELLEKRITRELWERVFPLVHADRRPLTIEAGPDRDHLAPFEVDQAWGAPWTTTWFRLSGEVPAGWRDRRVEAVIDLGFTRAQAGFQAEGAVVAVRADGSTTPLQGIHPNRTSFAVEAAPGPVELLVEAASNPAFPPFRPSPLGSPDTAGERPLYRFRRAQLVLVDSEAEALMHDLDVLNGVMRSSPLTDPRRAGLLTSIVDALERVPDLASARQALARHLLDVRLDGRLDARLDGRLGVRADAEVDRRADHRVDPAADRRIRPGRHRIIATGHAHIDTAWLWPMRETKRKCARTFASAVALMDEYPEYRFSCSQAQQYAWIEAEHPELFKSIVERVEREQWIPVGGMWVEADMNLPSGESLVRQIVFGQRYFEERFGRRCEEVWIPDVFGYPAGLPQLFVAGGMRRFVTQKLSWNKQNRFPHHTFWWEGLDGTRVLTHFPPVDTYNAEITAAEVAFSIENFREHRWSTTSLMPFGYGDGGGGPTREMLERARRLAASDPSRTLEIGAPADFFAHVEREVAHGAPVPVWRGELYLEMHRGTLTSQLRTKLGNRRCERLLVEAELWAASLGRSADVDDLWRAVLTQQFHDVLPGSSIAWVHADAEAALAGVEQALEERIASLLADLCPAGLHVANPADAPLRAVVVLRDASGLDRTDGVQRLADGSIAVSVDVAPLATAPVDPAAVGDRVVVTEMSMVNRHLAVRWDAAGNLVSIIDLASARELVPVEQAAAVLELARDQPVEYDAWDLERWTRDRAVPMRFRDASDDPSAHWSDGSVAIDVVDRGPLIGRVRVSRTFGPSSCAVVYELRADDRRLLVHVDLDWQHDEHLLSIAFPLDVRAASASCDVQFGVVERPTHPSSPWDDAKFEVCAHRFVDLSEPSFGVAVLNDGRYGHCVFDGAVRVSLARAARYPDPDADRGRHAVTLAILPHDGDPAAVRAAARLLNSPPRLVTGRASGAARPPVVELVDGDRVARGIEVDAVKTADDGSGDLIVRLHEACGDRTSFTVRAGERIGSALRTNLLEEAIAGEEVGDGVVALTLRPFELVTLRLQMDTAT